MSAAAAGSDDTVMNSMALRLNLTENIQRGLIQD